MTTLLKIEANRQNALASTGPQTAEGKIIVSGNAIRHGLLSWKPVIPGLLWRLDRVSRYEREVTAIALEHAEARKQPKLDEAEQSVVAAQARANFAEGLRPLPADAPLDGDTAARFLEQGAGEADVDLYEMAGWPPYVNDSTLEDLDWTAGRLLECIQVVAKKAKMDADELINGMIEAARDSLCHAQKERTKLQASYDRERRSMLLPDTLTLEKVSRYETTLERSLFKALHELERRQAARDGQAVPLPVAVDVNLSGAAQE
jgi:hypothetical protein